MIPLNIAVTLGDSTALILSLVGLGALLAESAIWFLVLKWIGGLSLLLLGIRLLFSGIRVPTIENREQVLSRRKLFLNTYLVTALNPKGIIFLVAFLPQFINTDANSQAQLWVLAITFVCLAALNAAFYDLFAGKARQILSSSRTQSMLKVGGGTLLSGAGLWALTARQT